MHSWQTATSTPNAYGAVCGSGHAADLETHCNGVKAAYESELEASLAPVNSLLPGEYVYTICECLSYKKTGTVRRRSLQAISTGTTITYQFYLITTSPERQTLLTEAASEIKTSGPDWVGSALYTELNTVASTDSGSVVDSGEPFAAQVPAFAVPPSPPAPPPPPCNAQCDVYTDGASALTETVCVNVGMGSAATTCRPAYTACDAGQLTCTQDACGLKNDKKGKWRTSKCAKKVGKCNKKRIKKKCKQTCCYAGY